MASVVDICNLALANLGDMANVASIDPPEGSAQAGHCARFYPVVRDSMLERHDWRFATRRVALALLEERTTGPWAYVYAMPADMLRAIAVVDPAASDDATAQEFKTESQADGQGLIFTNQPEAVLRYVARVTDTARYSPLFTEALAGALSAKLAGPVLKGEAGISAAAKWQAMTFGTDGKSGLFGLAAQADANQQRTDFRARLPAGWTR